MLGWYGSCDEECSNLNLDEYADFFELVYQWIESDFHANGNQDHSFAQKFNELECGRAYFVTLKTGIQKVTILILLFLFTKMQLWCNCK